jgi:hypothetical protein
VPARLWLTVSLLAPLTACKREKEASAKSGERKPRFFRTAFPLTTILPVGVKEYVGAVSSISGSLSGVAVLSEELLSDNGKLVIGDFFEWVRPHFEARLLGQEVCHDSHIDLWLLLPHVSDGLSAVLIEVCFQRLQELSAQANCAPPLAVPLDCRFGPACTASSGGGNSGRDRQFTFLKSPGTQVLSRAGSSGPYNRRMAK